MLLSKILRILSSFFLLFPQRALLRQGLLWLTDESMQTVFPSEIPPQLFTPLTEGDFDCCRFRLADRPDLQQLYATFYSHLPYSEFRTFCDHLLKTQSAGRGYWLVVEADSGLIGNGQLIIFPSGAELANLQVIPKQQGRGIGAAIVSVLTAIASHIGLDSLEIGVASGNSRALALYQRLGFEEDRKLRLKTGQPALILRRVL